MLRFRFSPSTCLQLFSSSIIITIRRQYAAEQQTERSSGTSSSNEKSSPPKPPPEADFNTTCPFQCLGLTRSATKEEVKMNFLQLAKVHHPDVGGDAAKFKRVRAAYKQSIEMIATGYAAKTVQKTQTRQSYKAPNERDRNGETAGESETVHEEQQEEKTTTKSTQSSKTSSSYQQPQNPHANAKRTADFSSANSYANAERYSSSSRDQASAKNNNNTQYTHYHDFMARNHESETTEQGGGGGEPKKKVKRNFHQRDESAKPHNKNHDWFREMYESTNASWSKTTAKENEQQKKTSGTNQTSSASEKSKEKAKSNNNKNNTDSSSSSSTSTSTDEKEFGADEDWFQFRESFFRDGSRAFTPRDIYRLRFAQATSVQEIDTLYFQAMNESIFSDNDIGEPLHLALERYHLELGLGEKHLEKCFAMIDDWERRTQHTANCLYYQVILKLYTSQEMLRLFPDVDASGVTEVVWKVLQRMQDRDVQDVTHLPWWSLLSQALLFRDPHGYGGQS